MKKTIIKESNVKGRYGDFHMTKYKIDEYEVSTREYDTFAKVEVRIPFENRPKSDTLEYYLPEIFIEDLDKDGNNNANVTIQTTSYGSLKEDEFQLYMDALKKGKEVADLIKKEIVIPLSDAYKK